jgi:hypothetical protein
MHSTHLHSVLILSEQKIFFSTFSCSLHLNRYQAAVVVAVVVVVAVAVVVVVFVVVAGAGERQQDEHTVHKLNN